MAVETIPYHLEGKTFKGYAVYQENGPQKMPGILIAHAWMGQDDFAKGKASALADLGYVALAGDVYGDGKTVSTADAAAELMLPLFCARKELRARMVAGYMALKEHPRVDPNRMAAIGFCFGGLCVTELLRSGVELKAVVSFHGLMGTSLGKAHATTEPNAANLRGAFLALHGFDDPLVSSEDVAALEAELTAAGVDWQLHVYGHTAHAFTNPQANDPSRGLKYNPKAEKRAWQAMRGLFQETLAN